MKILRFLLLALVLVLCLHLASGAGRGRAPKRGGAGGYGGGDGAGRGAPPPPHPGGIRGRPPPPPPPPRPGALPGGVGRGRSPMAGYYNRKHQTMTRRGSQPISHAGRFGGTRVKPVYDRHGNVMFGTRPGQQMVISSGPTNVYGNGRLNDRVGYGPSRVVTTGTFSGPRTEYRAEHFNRLASPDPARAHRYEMDDGTSVYTRGGDASVRHITDQQNAAIRFLSP